MNDKNLILVHYNGGKTPFLPLGVLYVANSLQNHGFSPHLIPSDTAETKFGKILSRLQPLYVGFSVFTSPHLSEMISLSKVAKKKGHSTVWGGYHSTVLAEQCIREPFIDYVVCGEGEETSIDFSTQFSEGHLGLNTIFKSPRIIEGLDRFRPALDLIDLKEYVSIIPDHLIKKYGPLTSLGYILTSRGCLSRCKFCGVHSLYRDGQKSIWRSHSPDFVQKQVRYIKSKVPGLDSIIIWDDNFFRSNRLEERSRKILEMLIGEDLRFTLEARATFLRDKRNVDFLKEMGCLQVFIGAESGSQSVLDLMQKDAKVEDYLRAVENCLDKDLPVRLSFFYGYPGETLEDIHQTKGLLKILESLGEGVTISGPKMYRPVPGTEGFIEATKLGFVSPENTQDWARVNSNADPNLLPWLVNELKREGIESGEIQEWLGIRKNT